MNTGVLASRYAKAFLTYVSEAGVGEKAYSQASALVSRLEEIPQLKDYILRHDEIALEKKSELLATALGESLMPEFERFLRLVTEHRRMEYFCRMLCAFIDGYRELHSIKVGSLVTAVPKDNLRERLEGLFHDKTGCEIHFETSVNEDLLGGFVFELDGYRLDASVRSQLDRISRKLVDDTNRII